MEPDFSRDVVAIREWMTKEPYLPQDFDDLMIKKFLHSCYGSLERTKKCIDRFCTTRSVMTESFTKRDPLSPKLQTAFDITSVTTYNAGEDEIGIHLVNDPTLEHYNFYDILKTFCIQSDHWLKYKQFFARGHIIIVDIKYYTLKIIAKINVMYYRDFILFLLEGMPVRVKQVHLVNCPSFYDKFYALVKPILPEDIKNIIKFHVNPEGLHKHVDKKYLPVEYGGDAPSMLQRHKDWVKEIQGKRDMYLNDNMWRADLTLKQKSTGESNTMNGSFKTLSID